MREQQINRHRIVDRVVIVIVIIKQVCAIVMRKQVATVMVIVHVGGELERQVTVVTVVVEVETHMRILFVQVVVSVIAIK
jgi:hypothetical protein